MPHLHQSPQHTQSRASAEQVGESMQTLDQQMEGAALPPPPLQLKASVIQRECGVNESCSAEDPLMSPPPIMSEGEVGMKSTQTPKPKKKRQWKDRGPYIKLGFSPFPSLNFEAGLGGSDSSEGDHIEYPAVHFGAGRIGKKGNEKWGIKKGYHILKSYNDQRKREIGSVSMENSIGKNGFQSGGEANLFSISESIGEANPKNAKDGKLELNGSVGMGGGLSVDWGHSEKRGYENTGANLNALGMSIGAGISDRDKDGTPEYHSEASIGPLGFEFASEDPIGHSPLGNLLSRTGMVDPKTNQTNALWNRFFGGKKSKKE